MAEPNSILVLGAGELGTAVLDALTSHPKRHGSNITILLRQASIATEDPAKKKQNDHFRSLGVKFEAGDLVNDSAPALSSIFARYHTIIACTGMGFPPGSQLKISQAVLAAGVPRFFPWQWGVDYDVIGTNSAQDLFDEQLQVRALLRAQTKTDWIIVSNGLFMSFLFLPAFGPVDLSKRVLRCLGGWDNRVTLTTPKDIGIMAAEITYEPGGLSHQVVYIAGDTVSYGQVADMVEERFGGSFKREEWSMDILQKKLSETPNDMFIKYQNVFGAGHGVAWDMDKTANSRRGIKLQGAKSYLEDMEI